MEPILWSILLLALGVGFLALELFVPSGGVLSFLAIGSILASVIVGFTVSPRFGAIMLGVTVAGFPMLVAAAVKWWPHTPIGRLILIGRPESPDEVLPVTEEYRGLAELIGQHGKAKTKMLPSGTVLIQGRTYDAMSDGIPIEPGETVQVVDIRTNRIVVHPAPNANVADIPSDDVLSRPVDSFGIEGLDDPLS